MKSILQALRVIFALVAFANLECAQAPTSKSPKLLMNYGLGQTTKSNASEHELILEREARKVLLLSENRRQSERARRHQLLELSHDEILKMLPRVSLDESEDELSSEDKAFMLRMIGSLIAAQSESQRAAFEAEARVGYPVFSQFPALDRLFPAIEQVFTTLIAYYATRDNFPFLAESTKKTFNKQEIIEKLQILVLRTDEISEANSEFLLGFCKEHGLLADVDLRVLQEQAAVRKQEIDKF